MKKLLLALALLLIPAAASAQCNGVFPANTLCGNLTASPKTPGPISSGGTVVGPGSSTVDDIAVWNNTSGTLLKDVPFVTLCTNHLFSSSLIGCVPASGGGTANFLRADGTWAPIPADALVIGTTVISGGTTLGFLYNNAGLLANSSFMKQITNSASTPSIQIGTTGSTGDDSAVIVTRALTPASGLLNSHAFRDETIATSNASASAFSGYASFDCAPQIIGANITVQNHIHCFQARAVYSNTGSVTEWAGFTSQAAITTPTSIGAVYGFQMSDGIKSGGGAITTQYAVYSNPLSAGATNYFLFGAGTLGTTANASVLNGELYVGGRLSKLAVEVSNYQYAGATQQGIATSDTNAAAGTGSAMTFWRNAGQVGAITETLAATNYTTASDERLKNFTGRYQADKAIRIIRADPVRTFNWKSTGDADLGWGAQSSYKVSPDLASPGKGAPGDSDFQPWGVDKGKRTPYLWAAVTQLLDRVDSLERQLKAKKRKLH